MTRVVVIGNGMVGQRFLEKLVARGEAHEITVFCEEPRPAYDRVQLTSFFSGKTAADLNLADKSLLEKAGVTLRLNDPVLSIDPIEKFVHSARYRAVPYDKLVFATGSTPFVPQVAGRERRDCFVYRTIEDLEMIAARAQRSKVGVVVGGGLLGLEAAKALKDLGLETHIVEFAPRLMSVQLDDAGGRLLRRKIEALGVMVHTSKETTKIVKGAERRHKLLFADGIDVRVAGLAMRVDTDAAALDHREAGSAGQLVARADAGREHDDVGFQGCSVGKHELLPADGSLRDFLGIFLQVDRGAQSFDLFP